jgi:hypothetical protein
MIALRVQVQLLVANLRACSLGMAPSIAGGHITFRLFQAIHIRESTSLNLTKPGSGSFGVEFADVPRSLAKRVEWHNPEIIAKGLPLFKGSAEVCQVVLRKCAQFSQLKFWIMSK